MTKQVAEATTAFSNYKSHEEVTPVDNDSFSIKSEKLSVFLKLFPLLYLIMFLVECGCVAGVAE